MASSYNNDNLKQYELEELQKIEESKRWDNILELLELFIDWMKTKHKTVYYVGMSRKRKELEPMTIVSFVTKLLVSVSPREFHSPNRACSID